MQNFRSVCCHITEVLFLCLSSCRALVFYVLCHIFSRDLQHFYYLYFSHSTEHAIFLFLSIMCISVCPCVFMYTMCMQCSCRPEEGDTCLELELQIVTGQIWVGGNEPSSSAQMLSVPNCGAIPLSSSQMFSTKV